MANIPVHGSVVPFVGGGFGVAWVTGGSYNPRVLELFGGIKAFMPGGGAAFVIRPVFQRTFLPESGLDGINSYGVAFGMSVFVGGAR